MAAPDWDNVPEGQRFTRNGIHRPFYERALRSIRRRIVNYIHQLQMIGLESYDNDEEENDDTNDEESGNIDDEENEQKVDHQINNNDQPGRQDQDGNNEQDPDLHTEQHVETDDEVMQEDDDDMNANAHGDKGPVSPTD